MRFGVRSVGSDADDWRRDADVIKFGAQHLYLAELLL